MTDVIGISLLLGARAYSWISGMGFGFGGAYLFPGMAPATGSAACAGGESWGSLKGSGGILSEIAVGVEKLTEIGRLDLANAY